MKATNLLMLAFVGVMALASQSSYASTIYLVFFDFESAEVSASNEGTLNKVIKAYNDLKTTTGQEIKVCVIGHDDTHARTSETALNVAAFEQGRLRASAVVDYLAEHSEMKKFLIGSEGDTNLLVKTPTGVREPQNRRVSIFLADSNGSCSTSERY